MDVYTVGSLGSIISGEPRSQSGSKIVFQEVQPRKRLKKSGSFSVTSKATVLSELQKKGKKIKESFNNVLLKKRRPEIAGDEHPGTIGKSWKHLRDSHFESEVDGLEGDCPTGTFARNAARRVHIKNNTKKHVDDPEREERTVYVGNIPCANAHKKKLMKFFSNYGDVDSVRLRCVPLSDPRSPKKVAVIKQDFHPKRTSICAYVVFKTAEQARNALQANGSLYFDHHLRVDLSGKREPEVDPKKSVFIGNLSYETEDEELWKMFSSCGEISSIRIIRDSLTAISKGIAYVNFQSPDAVELALQLNGEKLGKRSISVQRYKPSRNQNPSRAESLKSHKGTVKSKGGSSSKSFKDLTKKKKKEKRKKQRGKEESSGISEKLSGNNFENEAEERSGNDSSLKNIQVPAASKKHGKKHGKKSESQEKTDTSFMGRVVENPKKKRKKMTKSDLKKKKLALILTGKTT